MNGRSQSSFGITTAELKDAWQQGRKEPFYPYGRTHFEAVSKPGLGAALPSTCTLFATAGLSVGSTKPPDNRTAMVRTHQTQQAAFRSVLVDDIE